jgi:hypothetical protein
MPISLPIKNMMMSVMRALAYLGPTKKALQDEDFMDLLPGVLRRLHDLELHVATAAGC